MISITSYDRKLFIELQNNLFECPICYNIMKDPAQCSQGHVFCRHCVAEHLIRTESCPTCREPLTKEKLLSNKIICSLIEDSEVHCFSYIDAHQQSEDNPVKPTSTVSICEWRGKLKDAEDHYQQCQFAQTNCPHNSCDEILLRKDLPRHIENCVHALAISSTWSPLDIEQNTATIDVPLPALLRCPIDALPCSNSCLDLKGSAGFVCYIHVHFDNRHCNPPCCYLS
jgi:hypothetical protein